MSRQRQDPQKEPHAVVPATLTLKAGDAAEGADGTLKKNEDKVDREMLCNDVVKTQGMAMFVGGFALGGMVAPPKEESGKSHDMDVPIYCLAFMAVHASTCSALTSAFLYRVANHMEDGPAFQAWAKKYALLLMLPLAKFVMGALAYLVSVIFISWRDLEGHSPYREILLIVGVMSMSTVLGTVAILHRSVGEYSRGSLVVGTFGRGLGAVVANKLAGKEDYSGTGKESPKEA